MKTKVIKNEAKKTVTVVVSPVIIPFTDYLFERYNGERFFAGAVLKDADLQNDIYPLLKEILAAVNDVAKEVLPKGEKFVGADLFTMKEDEYRLVSKNIDKDGNWDKQFKINLSSKNKSENKRFLFKDLKGEQPISKEDGWKHFYAIEIEISAGYNEDEFEKYIYSVFHRAISIGAREFSSFEQNDGAWDGFDFAEEKDEKEEFYETSKELASEDDLPF